MPLHDWTSVAPGAFHDFHLAWIAEIRNALNHDVPRPQVGTEHLLDIRPERQRVGGAGEEQRRRRAGRAHRRHQRGDLPVAAGHVVVAALAARRSAVEPRQRAVRARLVEEDEAAWIDGADAPAPSFALLLDVGAVALTGGEGLFFAAGPGGAAPARRWAR